MRNLTVVGFDIRNTLVKNGENTQELMIQLVNNLKNITQLNGTDGVLVCTVTDDASNELGDVKEPMDFFYNLLKSENLLGIKTYSDGYYQDEEFFPYEKMKTIRIKDYVNRLNEKDNVKEVIYFDDAKFYVDFFNMIKPIENSEAIKVEDGLTSINNYFEMRNEKEWTK